MLSFSGLIFSISWCARQDLNLRPPDPQSGALSTELRAPHMKVTNFVSSAKHSHFHVRRGRNLRAQLISLLNLADISL